MANLITSSRLVLLLVVVWLFYQPVGAWQFANFFLIILIFVTDGVDGYVARKRHETSLFGAMFDIAGDRIVELTLWVVAAERGLVPIVIPLIFIIRGVIVDTIRANSSTSQGVTPFALMQSRVGKLLVAGKPIRIVYAVIKAAAFCGLSFQRPFPAVLPKVWSIVGTPLHVLTYTLVYLAVALCILRGLPVVIEFIQAQRRGAADDTVT